MSRTPDPVATALDPPPGFRLVTLGDTGLRRPDGSLVLANSKRLALLTYLHCAPDRSSTRTKLISLFWANDRAADAETGALRSALSRLRADLGGPDAFVVRPGEVALAVSIRSDRDDFLDAIDAGRLEDAVNLYRGRFFEEFADPGAVEFEQWADIERIRLERLFLSAADTSARRALDRGEPRVAVAIARRVRSRAPDAELGWQLVLQALLLTGNALDSVAEAEAFERWLSHQGRPAEAASAELIAKARSNQSDAVHGAPPGTGLIADLVGREREFAALVEAWRRVGRGPGQYLHLEARAGFGKTRLLTDFASRLEAGGAKVVLLRANPGDQAIGFALATDLVASLARLPSAIGVDPDSAAILVGLEPRLSARYPGARPARSADVDLLNSRRRAVTELLAAVSEDQRLAILIDDLHWIDAPSREVLRSLAGRVDQSRVLLVTAGRPGFEDGMLSPSGHRLQLGPILSQDIGAMLESLGQFRDLGWEAEIVAALQGASGGSPLLILEAVRWSCERGALSLQDGIWTDPDRDALVQQLARYGAVDERIRAIDPATRRLLLTLCLAGVPLTEPTLLTATDLSAPRLRSALTEAERRGYVTVEGGAWGTGHEEIAAAFERLAAPDEVLAVHAALGRTFAVPDSRVDQALVRAARHLTLAAAEPALAGVFRRWVALHRRRGDRHWAAHLAAELLGDLTTEARVSSLVGGLPWTLRWGIGYRHVAVAAAVAMTAGMAAVRAIGANPGDDPTAPTLMTVVEHADGLTLRAIPFGDDAFASADTITEQSGTVFGTIRPGGRVGVFPMRLDPARRHVAYVRLTADSGALDVFTSEIDGPERRVTSARGDDISPDWSPDGQRLVISTARWSNPERPDGDIAVVEPKTGEVRALTRDPHHDSEPRWSPDGTRIVFVRRLDGTTRYQLCWVTANGGAARCSPTEAEEWVAPVWRDPNRLVVLRRGAGGTGLVEIELETDSVRSILPGVESAVIGEGVAVVGTPTASGRADRAAFALTLDRPARRRPVRPSVFDGPIRVVWSANPASPRYLAGLRLGHLPRTLSSGVPLRLWIDGVDQLGTPMDVPAAVLRWRSRDTTIVAIGPNPDEVRSHKPGSTWISVSAGGWREDSIFVTVLDESPKLAGTEDWADTTLSGWSLGGEPRPRVVAGAGDSLGFLNNGDQAYFSGGISKQSYDASSGLFLETRLATPITRDRWQRVVLRLIPGPGSRFVDGGVVGGPGAHCVIAIPHSEGPHGSSRFTIADGYQTFQMPLAGSMTTSRWYSLVLQLFPDGTCGAVMEGKQLWRSTAGRRVSDSVRVAIEGQTVGAAILVGPMRVWRGIYRGVSWDWQGPDSP
jgi:DNA-binding SARP family transcriptional activator